MQGFKYNLQSVISRPLVFMLWRPKWQQTLLSLLENSICFCRRQPPSPTLRNDLSDFVLLISVFKSPRKTYELSLISFVKALFLLQLTVSFGLYFRDPFADDKSPKPKKRHLRCPRAVRTGRQTRGNTILLIEPLSFFLKNSLRGSNKHGTANGIEPKITAFCSLNHWKGILI